MGMVTRKGYQLDEPLINMVGTAWRTQDSKFGYNICDGGEGVSGWHPSETTRRKMFESARQRVGEKNSNFGHRWTDEMKKEASIRRRRENLSEETLRKMSVAASGRNGKNNSFFGKHHSDETKQKLAEKRYRKVRMLSLEHEFVKEYPSIKSASEETGINKVAISNCCRGITKTSGGYIWEYLEKL